MADESRTQSTPDPVTDQPLPPIPDGGLAGAMPGWLREDPPAGAAARADVGNDPAAFLTEDDLPPWLRHLASGQPPPAPAARDRPAARPIPPKIVPAPSGPTAAGRPDPATSPTTPPVPPLMARSVDPSVRDEVRPIVQSPDGAERGDRSLLLTLVLLVVLAAVVLAILYARGVI